MWKWQFSVNTQQAHNVTWAEYMYNEYTMLLSFYHSSKFKFLIFTLLSIWNVLLVIDVKMDGSKQHYFQTRIPMIYYATACSRHSKSWNKKQTYICSPRLVSFISNAKKRIVWLCPSRFRFRTSPCYLMVVLLPSWGKNKCRALKIYIIFLKGHGLLAHCFVRVIVLRYVLKLNCPGQNDLHFANDIFRCNFVNEKFCMLIEISLKFVPKGSVDNNPALV